MERAMLSDSGKESTFYFYLALFMLGTLRRSCMRQVVKKTGVFLCGLMVMGLVAAGSVQAVVLTFDDVPGGSIQNQFGNMPTYKGFTFSSTLDWIDVEGSFFWNFGAHSETLLS